MKPHLPLIVFLLIGGSAQAQAQSLTAATKAFATAATADWITTYQTTGPWVHESNPTIAWLYDRPAVMVMTGAAIDVAGVWGWNRYVGRHHHKLAIVGLYAASGLRLYFAQQNVRNVHIAQVRYASYCSQFPATGPGACPPSPGRIFSAR
jgi:hypothetical protein